jgi:two-component system phosphate regulon sensor histidine kinase PhoR
MTFFWLWRRELAALVLMIGFAAVLSYFIGNFITMIVLILSFIIIRQAMLITRLERWLSRGANTKMPTTSGIWADIYYHFYRIKKNSRKRKKKLGKIIELFHRSTDVLPDAAIVLDSHGEIEWSNKQAKNVLGIKKSDKGQRLDNLIRAPEFAEFLSSKKKKPVLTLPSPVDSKIILQFRRVSYGIKQHLIIAQDVTQQNNLEAMRKSFVDNVSHELRTPLTVLKGYLETLCDVDDQQSEMLTNAFRQMHAQTDRMQYLVDDLLLLARLETQTEKKNCVDVAKLLSKICQEILAIEKDNQRITLNLESDYKIYGEEQDLQSAFTNLLSNALKYSLPETPIKVIWKKKAAGMILDVIDQGEGIAAEDIPRVTERFYRAEVKREKKLSGTGLGLAIVKHVLINHDAKLLITSKVGQGSRFRCIFPASRIC